MKKSVISIILVISLIVGLMPCQAYAGSGSAEDSFNAENLDGYWDRNWMSYLPDEAPLNELSIPGTTPTRSA